MNYGTRNDRSTRQLNDGSWLDVGDTPILTAEEELALAERAADGDVEARDHIILANLRLVVSISKRYQRRGVPLGDLVSEGNLGLIDAAGKFDPGKGFRFTTFAKHRIKSYVILAIYNYSQPIRVPHWTRSALAKWRRMEVSLTAALGHRPTHEQIGKALGLTRAKLRTIKLALETNPHVGSLDGGNADDDEDGHGECLADPSAGPAVRAEREDSVRDLRRRLGRLDAGDRSLIGRRFGLDGAEAWSATEVGVSLGMDRSNVYRLEKLALAKMAV